MKRIIAKFDRDHPLRRRTQVGQVKLGHLRVTRYNSKTVQGKRIVFIKVEYKVIRALLNRYFADDLW